MEIGVGDLIAVPLEDQSVTKARAVHNCWAAQGAISVLLLEVGAVRGCPGPAEAGAQGYCPLDGHAASRLCSPLPHHKLYPHQQHEVAGLQACVTPFAVCQPAVRRHSATRQGTDPLCHGPCSPLVCRRASAGLLADARYVPQRGQGVVKLEDLVRFGAGAERGAAAVVRQLAAVAKQFEEVVKQLEAVVEQLEAVVEQLEAVVQLLGELVKQFESVVQLFEAGVNHL